MGAVCCKKFANPKHNLKAEQQQLDLLLFPHLFNGCIALFCLPSFLNVAVGLFLTDYLCACGGVHCACVHICVSVSSLQPVVSFVYVCFYVLIHFRQKLNITWILVCKELYLCTTISSSNHILQFSKSPY